MLVQYFSQNIPSPAYDLQIKITESFFIQIILFIYWYFIYDIQIAMEDVLHPKLYLVPYVPPPLPHPPPTPSPLWSGFLGHSLFFFYLMDKLSYLEQVFLYFLFYFQFLICIWECYRDGKLVNRRWGGKSLYVNGVTQRNSIEQYYSIHVDSCDFCLSSSVNFN